MGITHSTATAELKILVIKTQLFLLLIHSQFKCIFRLYLLFPSTSSIFVLYFSNEERVRNILALPFSLRTAGQSKDVYVHKDDDKNTQSENSGFFH